MNFLVCNLMIVLLSSWPLFLSLSPPLPPSALNTQTVDIQKTDDAVLFSQDFTHPLSSTLFCPLTPILNANGIFCTGFPDPVRLLAVYSTVLHHSVGHFVHIALFSSYVPVFLYDPLDPQFMRSRTVIYSSCSSPSKHQD